MEALRKKRTFGDVTIITYTTGTDVCEFYEDTGPNLVCVNACYVYMKLKRTVNFNSNEKHSDIVNVLYSHLYNNLGTLAAKTKVMIKK